MYKEVCGLEGEDWENFQSGFMEGLEKGMKSEKGEYDKMFANLDSEVQELATKVQNVVVGAMTDCLLGPIIPAEMAPELWAISEAMTAIEALAAGIESIPEKEQPAPDAGLGVYLVVLGFMTSILIQKRRRRSKYCTETSRTEATEVKT